MKLEESIDYNIKIAWHAISRMYNGEALKNGITISIGYILLFIDNIQGTSATKIAPLYGLEARSITRTLNSMEEKGLIYRETDKKDRRKVSIFLTDKGKEKKEIAKKTVKDFNYAIEKLITPHKLKVFFEVIQEINKFIEEKKSFNP